MTPPPTARIPIKKIQLGDTQTRVAIDLGTVNRYAELMADGVNLPPVDIYVDEHGVHWLADGYHRIEAAESCGKTEIDATIHTGSLDVAPAWAAALGMTIEQAFPELVAPAPEVDGPGNPLMPKPSKSPAP